MNSRCICFAVDKPYLFPALASAIHLKKVLTSRDVDVLVYCIDMNAAIARDFLPICQSHGILLKHLAPATLDGLSGLFSSFFLDRFLPDQYRHVLFFDADVQVWQPIDALLHSKTAGDIFLAVADPITFAIDLSGPRSVALRRYMAGIGLNGAAGQTYFNSGVLRIDRAGWNDIGMQALHFIKQKPDLCRFADQSALNAVSSGRHRMISLKWNFPIFLRNGGIDQLVNPAIYHFMSQPKPWQGVFKPWSHEFQSPYLKALQLHPELEPYSVGMPPTRHAKYLAQQRFKWGWESLVWRSGERHARILAYEAAISSGPIL